MLPFLPSTFPLKFTTTALMLLLQDRDPRVWPSVLAAIVAARLPQAEALLLERLRMDDFVVRTAAANGLAELKATAALP